MQWPVNLRSLLHQAGMLTTFLAGPDRKLGVIKLSLQQFQIHDVYNPRSEESLPMELQTRQTQVPMLRCFSITMAWTSNSVPCHYLLDALRLVLHFSIEPQTYRISRLRRILIFKNPFWLSTEPWSHDTHGPFSYPALGLPISCHLSPAPIICLLFQCLGYWCTRTSVFLRPVYPY